MINKAAVIIGSGSDLTLIKKTTDILTKLGVEHELFIASAHRTPEKIR